MIFLTVAMEDFAIVNTVIRKKTVRPLAELAKGSPGSFGSLRFAQDD